MANKQYYVCKKSLAGFTIGQKYCIEHEEFYHNKGSEYSIINDNGIAAIITDDQFEDCFEPFDNTNDIRSYNIGQSDYSKHSIQPWDIWVEYNLDPFDADIVKRVLRTKLEPGLSKQESRILDYEKIIHICKKKIELINSNKLQR